MWQVIGQDKILALLDYSLKSGDIAHAYLLLGPQHVGKRTLAISFAQALNCDGQGAPCGQCASCRRIWEGKHSDVISIGLGVRRAISIDDIRELQHLANLPPYEGKHRVFIIDGAEYLSVEAANALLKILEEPPPKLTWLLLASDDQYLLPTVVSRCQRLELRPLPREQMRRFLIESRQVEWSKADLLSRLSQGCLGWALSALDGDEWLEQRCQVVSKLSSLLDTSFAERFDYAQARAAELEKKHEPAVELVNAWFGWWRDLLLTKMNGMESIANIDYQDLLRAQASVLSLVEIREFIGKLYKMQQGLVNNANLRLMFEWLMVNMPRKELLHE
jgi:DNA polymerase-3 subunit delta'